MTKALTKGFLGMLLAFPFVSTQAVADCRGFICGLVQGIPVVGPAAQDVDQGIAGIKDRGSDADVLHQATSLGAWNNPMGRPATAPAPPPPQVAGSSDGGVVNFSIQDGAKYLVYVKFFSKDREYYWPDAGSAWKISDSGSHDFRLSCKVGEQVCYGAAFAFSGGEYWGVGIDGREGCKLCCLTCGTLQANVSYSWNLTE